MKKINLFFKRIIALGVSAVMIAVLFCGCSAVAQRQLQMQEQEREEELAENENDIIAEDTSAAGAEDNVNDELEPALLSAVKTSTTYTISFAGDCTLGSDYENYGAKGTFVEFVGDRYDYPFKNSLQYFGNDDMTIVNLECVLSDFNVPVQKSFRFRGPPENVNILKEGSIEVVNMANNHIYDFGNTGYADTAAVLSENGVVFAEQDSTAMYTTKSGLTVGIYAAQFYVDKNDMANDIAAMREAGAEIIIFSCHWGSEGQYRASYDQKAYAHAAIDAGADIVFGHHPHVLQPIEEYNGKMIYYSLGNFAYGGHLSPRDKDTAIIQQKIIRHADGTLHLGETVLIPYCLSSTTEYNDYCPTPYTEEDEAHERIMSKLLGTYTGPDLYFYYGDDEEETEEETENSAEGESGSTDSGNADAGAGEESEPAEGSTETGGADAGSTESGSTENTDSAETPPGGDGEDNAASAPDSGETGSIEVTE